jgi:hypothetical protein
VRKRLSPKLRRRVDPDDIVHSAFRSFFLDARTGAYELERSSELWRLLASITLHKLHRFIEKQTAAKRAIHLEGANSRTIADCLAHDPTAADVVAAIELFSIAFSELTSEERFALTSSMRGAEVEEIGASLDKSNRTARRLLSSARAKIAQRLVRLDAGTVASKQKFNPATVDAHLRYEDYTLAELLGSGGMGKVYRAIEKETGRTVAVKALHKARQANTHAVAQFVREAQLLARLRHRNIVGVHGLGRFPAGGFFMVMEYVDGVDLQDRVRQGPVTIRDAVAIMEQVASAAEHAHENGIIHCDLKPGNVLIDGDLSVTVTDFGFAYLITDHAFSNNRGLGGTIGYVAPEVLYKGESPSVAADVYALGAMLSTLCTGAPPIVAKTNTSLPQSLSAVVAKCVADNPQQRYPSVGEFIRDLKTHASNEGRPV